MLFMQKSPLASISTIIAHMAIKSLSAQTPRNEAYNHIWAQFMLFMHKKPKCINFNNYCAYDYIKPYSHKLGIMKPKATFERNLGYLCRKAKLHPCGLLLHIWLLIHFLRKLRIIKPKPQLSPFHVSCAWKAQTHPFELLLHIWLY